MAESNVSKFLGLREVRSIQFMKACLSEFIGTLILILVGCGGVVTIHEGAPVSALEGAIIFAPTVATIVWTFNSASGAHINPAVSWCFMLVGQLSLFKCLAFVAMQCAGATAGAALVWVLVPPHWRGTLGSTVVHEETTLVQAFGVELLCTCMLLLCVMASSDPLRKDHGGSMPLSIGIVVFMQSVWGGKPTGCSMNPARTLGPALVSDTWDHHWMYWLAPIIGGSIGTLLYTQIFAEKPEVPTIEMESKVPNGNATLQSPTKGEILSETETEIPSFYRSVKSQRSSRGNGESTSARTSTTSEDSTPDRIPISRQSSLCNFADDGGHMNYGATV